MDAIVLCGGKGTRLASVVSDVPKPLARVAGRPFLDRVLQHLSESGLVSRAILATGHLAESVASTYGDEFGSLALAYSEETIPLGTGGAVLQAICRFHVGTPCFVLNGDSFVDADLPALLGLLDLAGVDFGLSIFEVSDASRFGTVDLDGNRVVGFAEKHGRLEPGWINAGIYVLRPLVLSDWAAASGKLSLEEQILPRLVANRRVAALRSGTRFIDIGLPESYASADSFFSRDVGKPA